MKSIATLIAFLVVGSPAHAETADCRSLPNGGYQCDDGLIFRHLPDGGFEMSDTELFQMLPDGTIRMRGIGRRPAITVETGGKAPVSQPPPDKDVRR